jgi:nitrogen-specific signal transduction histidine kinase
MRIFSRCATVAARAMRAVRKLWLMPHSEKCEPRSGAVRDSGPGIDPEHLDRIFDAFYTTKSRGVGMGPSICRSIIHVHGGHLWMSANEPRGAVFQFTLPGLTSSFRAAQLTREPYEYTESDAAHQPAYEGNKRPHHLGRGRVSPRPDRR